MPRQSTHRAERRRYDQYCGAARALDAVGDRWTLLVVRELLAGPRRYTDLHADLPGVSTDVLASRLRDMERDGVVSRRRLPPPAAASVYELTDRGQALLPVLTALYAWGSRELAEPRPTDAVRAHWLALPLRERLAAEGGSGLVEVRLDEGAFGAYGAFHLWLPPDPRVYAEGPAPGAPDARVILDSPTAVALTAGETTLAEAVRAGRAKVEGEGGPAAALRGD
ncbi:winged helix-turn-helix transcriptional regulator [Streptomyces sp. NPDC050560]|uniref:winged helix-turn-helix transcriptional regulator n=1 Tax=Streptomyces sp. NPDC050560 TaxID=3365630 RepID=UPI0037A25935